MKSDVGRCLREFRYLFVSVLLLVSSGCCSFFSELEMSPGKKLIYDISKAQAVVLVQWVSLDDGEYGYAYSPIKDINVPVDQAVAWARAIGKSGDSTGAPFIGFLAKMVFIDKYHQPLGFVAIINWDCNVEISRCISHDGKFYVIYDPQESLFLNARSEELTHDVYAFLQAHMPEYLDQMRELYQACGNKLEDLLFKGRQ